MSIFPTEPIVTNFDLDLFDDNFLCCKETDVVGRETFFGGSMDPRHEKAEMFLEKHIPLENGNTFIHAIFKNNTEDEVVKMFENHFIRFRLFDDVWEKNDDNEFPLFLVRSMSEFNEVFQELVVNQPDDEQFEEMLITKSSGGTIFDVLPEDICLELADRLTVKMVRKIFALSSERGKSVIRSIMA